LVQKETTGVAPIVMYSDKSRTSWYRRKLLGIARVWLLNSYYTRIPCNPVHPKYIRAGRDPLQSITNPRQYKPPYTM
jgi:hypothetical protein